MSDAGGHSNQQVHSDDLPCLYIIKFAIIIIILLLFISHKLYYYICIIESQKK